MNYSTMLTFFKSELIGLYSGDEIAMLLRMLIEDLLEEDYLVLKSGSKLITDEQYDLLINALKELKTGRPIQHIIGFASFYGLTINVNKHTLIPRPETEELIDIITHELSSPPKRILDIGTGSGCIALSLKKNYPSSEVYGLDISSEAIKVATANSQKLNLAVEYKLLDVLNEDLSELGLFDLIVSNPPYIGLSEKNNMDNVVVNYEPSTALFVGDDKPLLFYERIANVLPSILNADGKLYLEINQSYGEDTLEVYKQREWNASLYKDMSAHDRFIKVWA